MSQEYIVEINGDKYPIPTWANWLGQDDTGAWYVYKNEPTDTPFGWKSTLPDYHPRKLIAVIPGEIDLNLYELLD